MENPALILPEFIGYLAGFIVTFLGWGVYFLWTEGPAHQARLRCLQSNLSKAQSAWSATQGSVVTLADYDADRERQQGMRTKLIIALLLPFLSWVGFLFSLILMFSLRFVPTRQEKYIFNSDLVLNEALSAEQVLSILHDFQN